MFHQNSEGMPERVKLWGCYTAAIAYLVSAFTQEEITQDQFIKAVGVCEQRKALIEDPTEPGTSMYVADPAGIFRVFGLQVQYLGKFPAGYQCEPGEMEILLWRRIDREQRIYHFTAGNGRGRTIYDPWAPFSITASEGDLRSKRIFRLIGEV